MSVDAVVVDTNTFSYLQALGSLNLLVEIGTRNHVVETTRKQCGLVVNRLRSYYTSFRAGSGYFEAKWGSTTKEAAAAVAELKATASGDYTVAQPIAGYPAEFFYRFELDRLVRVDISFTAAPRAPWSIPNFAQLHRILKRKHGDPAMHSDTDTPQLEEALGRAGLAFLCPVRLEDSAALWVLPETVIVLRQEQNQRLSLIYVSRQLATWATGIDEMSRAKSL